MKIRTIGIICAGQMGCGIAHVAATAGFEVVLTDIDSGILEDGLASIAGNLDRQIRRGTIKETGRDTVLGRIKTSTHVKAHAGSDLVVELDGFENEWARCLNDLGYSLLLQNELNKAEEYAREGLVIAKRAENRSLEALLFWTLGEILDAKELNEDARESYTKSADIKREIGEELDQFFIDNDY